MSPLETQPATRHDHQGVVVGTVVQGDQRGRLLGFHTANIELGPEHLHLADGVYIGTFDGGGCVGKPAAVSIGVRSTFYVDGIRLLEAHLLDFDGDLYGEEVVVSLGRYLRPQRRFDSLTGLTAQLASDVEAVRAAHVGSSTLVF